jgi:hypothetical protein
MRTRAGSGTEADGFRPAALDSAELSVLAGLQTAFLLGDALQA